MATKRDSTRRRSEADRSQSPAHQKYHVQEEAANAAILTPDSAHSNGEATKAGVWPLGDIIFIIKDLVKPHVEFFFHFPESTIRIWARVVPFMGHSTSFRPPSTSLMPSS